jgi:hypothetical protein
MIYINDSRVLILFLWFFTQPYCGWKYRKPCLKLLFQGYSHLVFFTSKQNYMFFF